MPLTEISSKYIIYTTRALKGIIHPKLKMNFSVLGELSIRPEKTERESKERKRE